MIEGQAWNFFWMVIGMIITLYISIVFERWNRFKDILREIALERTYFDGYPIYPNDLKRAHDKAFEFWRFLENKQWALNADGHFISAREVGKLTSFAYRTTAQIEKMISMQAKNQTQNVSLYLTAFQIEYRRIKSDEFMGFENKLRPSILSLLIPKPHPIYPRRADIVLVNYFDNLPKI